LLAACGSDGLPVTETNPGDGFNSTAVAFMSDVHFENIYGDLKSSQFSGIPTKDGKNATIRTMYAQLTSTRLFNENYFAFRAALDDAYSKGLRLVALPGDISDDAQPINIDGLADILHEYQAKGMRFFIAPGNHDPNEPYDDDEAGKNDFLTKDGKEQKIYAVNNAACKAKDPAVVCTNQLMEQGYEKLMTKLGEFGYAPNKNDVYWETPFSSYADGKYSYEAATAAADLSKRQFEICTEGEGGKYKVAGKTYSRCVSMVDASYLVEPVKGIWLLALDGNVHAPNANFDPANPTYFKGYDNAGDAGWNKMLTHKIHQIEWIKSVAARAKAQGKQLMAFSHYPTMDFYANQTDAMKAVFKPGAFQVSRMPAAATTAALAATGLPLHVGGHMHFNGTNDFKDAPVTTWSTCSRRRWRCLARRTRSSATSQRLDRRADRGPGQCGAPQRAVPAVPGRVRLPARQQRGGRYRQALEPQHPRQQIVRRIHAHLLRRTVAPALHERLLAVRDERSGDGARCAPDADPVAAANQGHAGAVEGQSIGAAADRQLRGQGHGGRWRCRRQPVDGRLGHGDCQGRAGGHSGQPETGGLRQDQRLRVLRRLPPHRVRRRAGPARHGRGARGAVQGVDGGVPGVAGGHRQSGGATVGPEPGAGGVPGAVQAGVRDPEGLGSGKPSDHFTIDLKAQKLSNASNSGLSFN
jgi:3',5'-cyclic AMP phosphodiesterase CpdA